MKAIRVSWAFVLIIAIDSAGAQDKSDATQSFNSPLGIGSGAVLAISQKGTGVSGGVEGQRSGLINTWSVGISATTDTDGKALLYSTSDDDAPGFKARIGLGYSSFRSGKHEALDVAEDKFVAEARCLDVAQAAGLMLPQPMAAQGEVSCGAYLSKVKELLEAWNPAEHQLAAKKSYQEIVSAIYSNLDDIKGGDSAKVCQKIKDVLQKDFKSVVDDACPGNIRSSTLMSERYRKAYEEIVQPAEPSGWYYKAGASWVPTISSAEYRPIVDGVADLETKEHWTDVLHRAAIDLVVFNGPWAAGVQVGFGETARIKTQNVCKTIANGDVTAQSCDVSAIGEPKPSESLSTTAVLGYDPLTFGGSTLFRTGAQLRIRHEDPSGSRASKTEMSLPLYISPVVSPLKVLVGIEPKWTLSSDDSQDDDFTVTLFIGARPSVIP